MEKTTVYLPADLALALKLMAKRKSRPQAELIREALQEYVGRDRPAPKSIGMGSDAELPAADAKAWVREQWRKKWAESR